MAETKTPKGKGPAKKLGPLPVWGWAAVGVGTYGVYYLYKQHSANVAAASSPSTDTTSGPGTAAEQYGAGSGVVYVSPNSVANTSTTGLTITAFAHAIATQLAHGGKFTQGEINQAVNQYLNGQPVSNTTLAREITNIVSPFNELGSQALAQGGLVKPVLFSTNVATVAHTPSEALHRAATAVVSQAANIQPSRLTVEARPSTTSSRASVTPKLSVLPASQGGAPFLSGPAVLPASQGGAPFLPGAMPTPTAAPRASKKTAGVAPAPLVVSPTAGFGANPVRDAGLLVNNLVTTVQNVGLKAITSFFAGLGL